MMTAEAGVRLFIRALGRMIAPRRHRRCLADGACREQATTWVAPRESGGPGTAGRGYWALVSQRGKGQTRVSPPCVLRRNPMNRVGSSLSRSWCDRRHLHVMGRPARQLELSESATRNALCGHGTLGSDLALG